jgi:3-deoxy-D-manno-octulosonate 8-phosphate phosphatase (KDO 8-P phosphatase)
VKKISTVIRRKARGIKLLILDVDGVMTDGGIMMNDRGEEIKRFNVRDGQGIKLLKNHGIEVALITGRFSKAVTHRARELGISIIYQSVRDKVEAYEKVKAKTATKDHEIAYIGDDLADLPLLALVGLAITVGDGWEKLRSKVDYVTTCHGGYGAVREVADILLSVQGGWRKEDLGRGN